jgi:pyruvate dehydrogenase E2 component (dihydrolipoamide acetyltransferase)
VAAHLADRTSSSVSGDAVAINHRMKVTMSSDHRGADAALAAQFLAEVRRLLENPVRLLV